MEEACSNKAVIVILFNIRYNDIVITSELLLSLSRRI
jgi:hypothetical protein